MTEPCAVKDALTGVVWTDDAQVVDLFVHKQYCAPSEFPRAVITIREAVFLPSRYLIEVIA